jgi:hypoxanthine-DNA glycosylase
MQVHKSFEHPFDAFVPDGAEVLMLGSFPSIKSFEDNFYYAHPQNQFWKILAAVYDEVTPTSIQEKSSFLTKHKIALWDMVQSCERENSLDSNLKNIKVNDIEGFLKEHPTIKKVCFTGKTSQKLYDKNFSHLSIPTHYLPSSSPAYRAMKFDEKVEVYRSVLSK